jgi:hypothetical protein
MGKLRVNRFVTPKAKSHQKRDPISAIRRIIFIGPIAQTSSISHHVIAGLVPVIPIASGAALL